MEKSPKTQENPQEMGTTALTGNTDNIILTEGQKRDLEIWQRWLDDDNESLKKWNKRLLSLKKQIMKAEETIALFNRRKEEHAGFVDNLKEGKSILAPRKKKD